MGVFNAAMLQKIVDMLGVEYPLDRYIMFDHIN